MTPGVDNEEENPPDHIDQEEIPQTVRRSTHNAAPIHRLEPTMREKAYHNNNLIMEILEANEHTIEYKTEEAIMLGQILAQTYNLSKGIKKLGDK